MRKDFDKLSENELIDYIQSAEKALRLKQDVKRKEVIVQLKELAASADIHIEISDLPKKTLRKGMKVPPKYQNPKNASQKWSGRGMKPNWLVDMLDQGYTLEEMLIKH